MPNELLNFLQDPANAWILYIVSGFLVFDGYLMHLLRRKVVEQAAGRGGAAGGGSQGAVVSGRVDGDARRTQWARQSYAGATALRQPPVLRQIDRILASAANLTIAAGFALAAWTLL